MHKRLCVVAFYMILCYTGHAALSPIWQQGMSEILMNFFVAVAAQVAAYYVCKWLDDHHKGK